jgi:hypothetical protein
MAMRGMNIFTSAESSMEDSENEGSLRGSSNENDQNHLQNNLENQEDENDNSILNEVIDEWNISMKFKQLDLEMKNLIEKHSWGNPLEQDKEINYDDVRRKHKLLPTNPRKELKEMWKQLEEEAKNGFGLGMSCPVQEVKLERQKSEKEKEMESEHRIEAIFAKYKIRDFSDQSQKNSINQEDKKKDEKIENKCSISRPLNDFENIHLSEHKNDSKVSENEEFIDIHSNVDKIVNECLNSKQFSKNELIKKNKSNEALRFDELDDDSGFIVKISQEKKVFDKILDELDDSVKLKNESSNFLDIKESINKIKLGQSDLFPKSKVLSPIVKKNPM